MKLTPINGGLVEDVHVAASFNSGNLVIHFRVGTTATGFEMPIPLAAQLAGTILLSLPTCSDTEVQRLFHALGIADISAQMPHPNLPTLKYRLECGVEMETSIDAENLRSLHAQIGTILDALEHQPKPPSH